MINGYDDVTKLGKENVDVALQSAGAISKGIQEIAAETGEFSKKSFEAGSSALEKLASVKSFDKAVEVQTDFLRTSYEGYVGQMAKVGEIVTDMAKDAYKPYESLFGKLGG
jgi:hypothetical protein